MKLSKYASVERARIMYLFCFENLDLTYAAVYHQMRPTPLLCEVNE